MAPSHHQFESKSSAAVRRRLSSSVAAKQKPNVTGTFASLTVSSCPSHRDPDPHNNLLIFHYPANVGWDRGQPCQQQYPVRNRHIHPRFRLQHGFCLRHHLIYPGKIGRKREIDSASRSRDPPQVLHGASLQVPWCWRYACPPKRGIYPSPSSLIRSFNLSSSLIDT